MGGFQIGDVVYSKIHHRYNGESIKPGDKGTVLGPCTTSSETAGELIAVEFENVMGTSVLSATQISKGEQGAPGIVDSLWRIVL